MNTSPISFYDLEAVDVLAKALKIDPQQIRQARLAFFKKSLGAGEALKAIPVEQRNAFGQAIRFHSLTEANRFDSAVDNASKLITRTEAGFSIETVVLKPATGRVALCVSSQVGCAAACRFCATGHMGVARNLAANEILDQVTLANQSLRDQGQRVRNIVFMGMGEPMHNEGALHETLETLQSPAAFNHSPSRLLVSTVGIPEPLVRMATRFPKVNFAISLHSADASVRKQIIPTANKHSLTELRGAIEELNHVQTDRSPVMIEYLMLDQLNDSPAAAEMLIDWLGGLRVHVNLIPFNPIGNAPELKSSPAEVIQAFSNRLRNAGYKTTTRYSLGRDIDAACGQLVREENRAVAKRLTSRAATPQP